MKAFYVAHWFFIATNKPCHLEQPLEQNQAGRGIHTSFLMIAAEQPLLLAARFSTVAVTPKDSTTCAELTRQRNGIGGWDPHYESGHWHCCT
jgi:hypothetical protein